MIRKNLLFYFTLGVSAILERTVYPPRGLIYDRNGKLWVSNKPVYDLMVVPENLKVFDTLELTQNLKISKKELIEKIRNAKHRHLRPSRRW